MASNTAAWLEAAQSKPLVVKSAPYIHPNKDEIVVKNAAVAINPLDYGLQDYAFLPLDYPAVLGSDLAGEVVEVGSSVTQFKQGDRVLGHALQVSSTRETNKHCEASFQEYTVVLERMASKIPETMPFELATVLPLALSTAACGLFQRDYLELQYPSLNPEPTGKTLLIWGGATSVGSNAIQLAVAAGYEVITTASPKNFGYVQKLGASQVFDYNSVTIISNLVAVLKGKTMAGVFDSIGSNGIFEKCADVLLQTEGSKFIAAAMMPPENLPKGINTKFIFGTDLKNNEVSKAVYQNFLPEALAQGKYIPGPEPHIFGKGLECIQDAMDFHKKGVSAKKVVVKL